MRLAVDGGGYATATSAFTDANHVAALQHDALTRKLAGYAGMAGDDSTSTQFATAYDAAANEGVGALADLVGSFASVGGLTRASLANHLGANQSSVLGGATVYDGESLPDEGYVAVLPSTPPSSLGGDSPALSPAENWILDHIEGFVWPNADTGRLRDAATTWRTAAEGLDDLADYCDAGLRGLDDQLSPEIPLAVAAIQELRVTVGEVAVEYAAIADSCDLYAAQVDEKRAQTLALVKEILAMVVEGVLISAAIGALTGGAGAAAGAGAVVARVAAQSPRFAAILSALRAAVTATSAAVRTSRTALAGARLRLTKFVNVAKVRSAARGEAGTIGPLGRWQRGWLGQHERSGSHTIGTHVGKTDEEILQRMRDQPWIKRSSSFTDQAVAEDSIRAVLSKERSAIADWLLHGKGNLRLEGIADRVVGRSADISGEVADVRGLRVILTKDADMPDGYRIFTAFPQP